MKTRNFFIKKHYRETERHYRLMGIATPKTYVGRNPSGSAVLISKRMAHWKPMHGVTENGQINPLGSEYTGLAHLELASAFLSDIDVSGWNLDNLGLKNGMQISKLDGGAAVYVKK